MIKKHIILCFSLIIVLLAFILFILFGNGIQCNSEAMYLPSKQGEAIWVTEDGGSWFRVDEKEESFCVGELTIDGETTKCHYRFAETDYVSILLNYEEFFGENKADDNSLIEYNGKCEFYKNKVRIELDVNKEQNILMEFRKQDDDFSFSKAE